MRREGDHPGIWKVAEWPLHVMVIGCTPCTIDWPVSGQVGLSSALLLER